MPPSRARVARACAGLLASACLALPAHALRIVTYNLSNYPGSTSAQRNPNFRTVLGPVAADVVVVQEMHSQAGVDNFRTNVLNTLEPGQWASAPFLNGNDTDNGLFYKPSKVQFLGQWAFYPNPANQLRFVSVYRLKPAGYSAHAAELRLYSVHFKASQGSSNEQQRLAEATGVRDSMNAMPAGTHAILLGDFNIYTSSEPAFQKLLEFQVNNIGRVYDPLGASGNWHDNGSFASIHTQCPCLDNCPPGFGFAQGGMDDRFDMFLPTPNMGDGEGLDVLAGTYVPVGNDGLHLNKDINVAPTIPEGQAYADALVTASDHLPVRIDVQLPARISVAASLGFGTVITGAAAASRALSIYNVAAAPGDELNYSFAAPAGFGAPGGSFALLATAVPATHTITMSTASPGNKAGTLQIPCDDPDTPVAGVALSGTVLAHAVASLDSLVTTTAQSIDFGDHPPGEFTDAAVRVHNRGYSAVQARLAVNAAAITGGGGRFAIVGGFSPTLVAGVGATYAVRFDAAGATADSAYTATLTFTSADEALPGGVAQPNLIVSLRALVAGATDVTGAVLSTRLHAPYPNPPGAAGTTLRFDLVRAAAVRLDVFDVAGRRVARVATGEHAAGRHAAHWDGRAEAGTPLAAGIYFVRLTLDGRTVENARIALVR